MWLIKTNKISTFLVFVCDEEAGIEIIMLYMWTKCAENTYEELLGIRFESARMCFMSFNNEQKLFFSIGCNKCLLAKLFVHQNQIENVENEKVVRVCAIRTKVLSIAAIIQTIHRLCDQQMSTFAYSC